MRQLPHLPHCGYGPAFARANGMKISLNPAANTANLINTYILKYIKIILLSLPYLN